MEQTKRRLVQVKPSDMGSLCVCWVLFGNPHLCKKVFPWTVPDPVSKHPLSDATAPTAPMCPKNFKHGPILEVEGFKLQISWRINFISIATASTSPLWPKNFKHYPILDMSSGRIRTTNLMIIITKFISIATTPTVPMCPTNFRHVELNDH